MRVAKPLREPDAASVRLVDELKTDAPAAVAAFDHVNPAGRIAAVGVAAAILLSLLFAFLAEATTQLICGTRPTPNNLFSGFWIALTGNPATYTAPADCALPVWQIRILDLVAVVLVAAIAVWVLTAYRRYRHSDRSFLTDLRLRPGFAPAAEIRDHLSAKAVLRRAAQLRPDIAKPFIAELRKLKLI